jgi:SAM-dependent methyltransferase
MSSPPNCLVCEAALAAPLYRAQPPTLDSLGRPLHSGAADVWFCDRCGHLQTTPLTDCEGFYEHRYAYHTGSLDEDRVLVAPGGRTRYETEVRAELMLSRLVPVPGARVLDYGCGKGNTIRRAKQARPDLDVYLFDVTDRYVEFWRQFCAAPNWSIGSVPPTWNGAFDAVASFYVLEHVSRPVESLTAIAQLLTPGGQLYLMVPNVHQNPADLLVADHTHHYSELSLRYLLRRAGFARVEVDTRSFPSALVAVAGDWSERTALPAPPPGEEVTPLRAAAERTASFWRSAEEHIRTQEAAIPAGAPVAIYGAGFYGAYVYTRLTRPERVRCFVDKNPFLQGREYYGHPVIAPEALDPAVRHVLVALNPGVARRAIGDVAAWSVRPMTYIYLGGD